jgi:hypothetical protein
MQGIINSAYSTRRQKPAGISSKFNVGFGLPVYLPFILICVIVISGCSSIGFKEKSQLMPGDVLFGADGAMSLDAVTEEPLPEEELYNSSKLSKTHTSKILDTLGEGIKNTIGVLEKGVKGIITTVAAGVVGAGTGVLVGGIYCLEVGATPQIYAACVATCGVLGAGGAMISSLTDPHY